jgi:hypothetical protein
MQTSPREARLRPEHANLYPALNPGVWEPAAALGRRLLVWSLAQPKAVRFGPRLLPDSHFEFRGHSEGSAGEEPLAGERASPRLRRLGDRSSDRECRLRPEYVSSYPRIPVGEWITADEATILVLEQRGASSVEELGERPLDPGHFEFRGGVRRGQRVALKTRGEDPEPRPV